MKFNMLLRLTLSNWFVTRTRCGDVSIFIFALQTHLVNAKYLELILGCYFKLTKNAILFSVWLTLISNKTQ